MHDEHTNRTGSGSWFTGEFSEIIQRSDCLDALHVTVEYSAVSCRTEQAQTTC